MSSSHRERIFNLLDEREISYQKLLNHQVTKTSEESAQVRGVDLSTGGKALVLKLDSEAVGVFVMSASRSLHTKKIKKALGKKNVCFASPEELATITGGLVPGSVPPFGKPILELDLYVDELILKNEIIAFNCGSLTDSVIMKVEDWIKVANPTQVFAFSK